MNKERLLTIIILPSMWLIYILFEIFSGNLSEAPVILFNFLLLPVLAFIGFLFYRISNKYKKGVSTKIIFYFTLTLIAFDQIIKIIIKFFFFDSKFYIIPKTLSFNPIINTKGSWLNVRFNTGLSFSFLIFINFLALFIFIELYRYSIHKKNRDFWADCCFMFIFSGSFCSLIDKIFYGGSLDFIGIGNLFIADFKDIFINIAIFTFLLACYKNDFFKDDNESTLKEDFKSIKEFFLFLISDFKSIFYKK